jgi:hypothetical protein
LKHGAGQGGREKANGKLVDLRALKSQRAAGRTTVFAVATLAIAIGGTAAVCSLVNAVLLRELSYRDADQLVAVWQHIRPLGLARVVLRVDRAS